MTKAETVSRLVEITGIDKESTEQVLEAFFSTIKDAMSGGEHIYIRGFGSFIVKKRAAKIARNIKLKSSVMVPASSIPFFKPSPEFTNQVKAGKTKSDK